MDFQVALEYLSLEHPQTKSKQVHTLFSSRLDNNRKLHTITRESIVGMPIVLSDITNGTNGALQLGISYEYVGVVAKS